MKANLLSWLQEAYPTIAKEWSGLMGGKTPKHLILLNDVWDTNTFASIDVDDLRAVVDEQLGWFVKNIPGATDPEIWVDADEFINLMNEGNYEFDDCMDEDDIRGGWTDAEDMDVVFVPVDDRDWSLSRHFFTDFKVPVATPTPAPKRRK